MDRVLEKKKGIALVFSKKALPYWFGGLMVIFIMWLIFRDDASTLRVNGDTLTVSEVRAGEFNAHCNTMLVVIEKPKVAAGYVALPIIAANV